MPDRLRGGIHAAPDTDPSIALPSSSTYRRDRLARTMTGTSKGRPPTGRFRAFQRIGADGVGFKNLARQRFTAAQVRSQTATPCPSIASFFDQITSAKSVPSDSQPAQSHGVLVNRAANAPRDRAPRSSAAMMSSRVVAESSSSATASNESGWLLSSRSPAAMRGAGPANGMGDTDDGAGGSRQRAGRQFAARPGARPSDHSVRPLRALLPGTATGAGLAATGSATTGFAAG